MQATGIMKKKQHNRQNECKLIENLVVFTITIMMIILMSFENIKWKKHDYDLVSLLVYSICR